MKVHLYDLAAELYHGIQKRRLPKVLQAEIERIQNLTATVTLKKKGESLNIVQISTVDNFGGAAIVAWRLHKAYNRQGHNAFMFVGDKLSDDSKVISIRDLKKDAQYLGVCRKEGLQYWNILSSFDIPSREEFKGADILQLHNLHGNYFNYLALPGLTKLKPAVWTLHDMQSFTGNCAFSYGCEKWETGCGDCLMLSGYPSLEKDTTDFMWRKKKELFRKSNFDIVVPSKWLYDIVKRSMLGDKKIHLIYNGVDKETFRPRLKSELRKKLNIPMEKIVFITSAAGGSKNPQKGGTYLLDALKRMKHKEKIVFISLGENKSDSFIEGLDCISTGHVYNEKELAEWYAAADIFLYPSIADNCPLTVLEAMACALPVITFDTGGIPEMVTHMVDGYVARYKDVEDLADGMQLFINDGELRESAGSCARAVVEKSFTIEKMVNSYLNLYYEILERENNKEFKKLM